MSERDPKHPTPRPDTPAASGDDAPEDEDRKHRPPAAWDPGPRTGGADGPRQSRRVFGREHRTRVKPSQQFIFVGLALLFLVGYFLFRQSCVSRVSRTYGALTGQPPKDGGAQRVRPRPTQPPMATMRPMGDPDDW